MGWSLFLFKKVIFKLKSGEFYHRNSPNWLITISLDSWSKLMSLWQLQPLGEAFKSKSYEIIREKPGFYIFWTSRPIPSFLINVKLLYLFIGYMPIILGNFFQKIQLSSAGKWLFWLLKCPTLCFMSLFHWNFTLFSSLFGFIVS